MSNVLEFIEEIVKESYQPIEDRSPNRFKKGNLCSEGGRLDYLASQLAQRAFGFIEMAGSLPLLILSDNPYSVCINRMGNRWCF